MMESSNASISAIGRHRFDIDGKGIRTLIVFSGCPLRCKYCINPYTWDGTQTPRKYSVEELIKQVSVDSVYFTATNGGITFGGGEPLLQSDFISDFIDKAPKQWNYSIETSLSVPTKNIDMLTPKIDTFIVDIKTLDSQAYRSYTERDLETAKHNLIHLIGIIGAERIVVRVPIIPSYVDLQMQEATINELRALGIKRIDAFRYKIKG